MSNFLIAFITAVGVAVWVYSKFMRTTGSNSQRAIGGALMAGFLAFLSILVILSFAN